MTFAFRIVAIILGVVLYKQFDFDTLSFKKPGLAVIYILTFSFAVYYLIRNRNGKVRN